MEGNWMGSPMVSVFFFKTWPQEKKCSLYAHNPSIRHQAGLFQMPKNLHQKIKINSNIVGKHAHGRQ